MRRNWRNLQKIIVQPHKIAEAASIGLIREDSDIVNDDNFVKPSLIDKQGIYPVFARYNTIGEEILGVEKLLKKLLKRYEAKEIAIVARTKRILEEVKKETDENIKMTLYNFSGRNQFRRRGN